MKVKCVSKLFSMTLFFFEIFNLKTSVMENNFEYLEFGNFGRSQKPNNQVFGNPSLSPGSNKAQLHSYSAIGVLRVRGAVNAALPPPLSRSGDSAALALLSLRDFPLLQTLLIDLPGAGPDWEVCPKCTCHRPCFPVYFLTWALQIRRNSSQT